MLGFLFCFDGPIKGREKDREGKGERETEGGEKRGNGLVTEKERER